MGRLSNIVLALSAFALTAAGTTALAQQRDRGERPRNNLRSTGEPGRVAAADWGLARRSREEGQWTAYRESLVRQ